MKHLKTFSDFLNEKEESNFEDKAKGHGYFKGISTSTARKKLSQMKDQAKLADNDPDAYKPLPGDTKGKKLLKPSKHTKKYHELYNDKNESYTENDIISNKKEPDEGDYSIHIEEDFSTITVTGLIDKHKKDLIDLGATVKVVGPGYYIMINNNDKKKILDYLSDEDVYISESLLEKATGDRSPIDNDKIEKSLEKKSKETGVPIPLLRIVMRRGMAAWKSGHRPGAGQEQWGYARLSSFLTKAPGTWGRPINDPKKGGPKGSYGADADVAQEVIKGGYDKKLKS